MPNTIMDKIIKLAELSEVEKIKYDSNFLRGTLVESLANPITGAINPDDTQVSKFHGIYQQHDRDLERERKKQKLEPAYSYLIRVRLPAGVASSSQWIQMDKLSDKYANGTLKLTTRQAFQFHGVYKKVLKKTIQGMFEAELDSIAACGDVNRNVMCNPNPQESVIHEEVLAYADKISLHLLPKTTAYHEIWLDKKLIKAGEQDTEPMYGKTYLPRKFKIGIAVPPYNDIDVFSQDLGFIAIEKDGKLDGFNVVVGGGFGTTFGVPETYPRLGNVIGFCTPEQVVDVAEKVILVQRDNGNRVNRKNARLKYTIDRMGVDVFAAELNKYLGYDLQAERPYEFIRNGDRYGWLKGPNGKWHLTLFVEGGRVMNDKSTQLKTALREIAEKYAGEFRLTGNQNLIISNVKTADKKKIDAVLKKYNCSPEKISGLRQNTIACVSLNTCSLAFAEAERYLPTLVTKIEDILNDYGLFKDEIVIRMTGCPNGCGRPYLGEIAFIGKSMGKYNMYLGANFIGSRLNSLYKETLSEGQILEELRPLLKAYAENRNEGERFGDFVVRTGVVKEIKEGIEFKH